MKYHIVTFIIGAFAAIGAMLIAGPFDSGPWYTCQHEDGNIDGLECMWVNEGKVWYNDGSEYRN